MIISSKIKKVVNTTLRLSENKWAIVVLVRNYCPLDYWSDF